MDRPVTAREMMCICSLVAHGCPPTEGHLMQCDDYYRGAEAIEEDAFKRGAASVGVATAEKVAHRRGATQAFEEARTVAGLFGGTLPFDRSRSLLCEEIEAGITRAEEMFKELPANTYDIIEEELEKTLSVLERVGNLTGDWLMREEKTRPPGLVSFVDSIVWDCVREIRGEEND